MQSREREKKLFEKWNFTVNRKWSKAKVRSLKRRQKKMGKGNNQIDEKRHNYIRILGMSKAIRENSLAWWNSSYFCTPLTLHYNKSIQTYIIRKEKLFTNSFTNTRKEIHRHLEHTFLFGNDGMAVF